MLLLLFRGDGDPLAGLVAVVEDDAVAGDGLAEVDVDAAVVDEDVVHLGVGALGVLLALKLDKGVAEALARLRVADDVDAVHAPEAAEDELEPALVRRGVQPAHKEDVLGRPDVRVRQVLHELQHRRARPRLRLLLPLLLRLLRRLGFGFCRIPFFPFSLSP